MVKITNYDALHYVVLSVFVFWKTWAWRREWNG